MSRGARTPEDGTAESDERYRRALAALAKARAEELRRLGRAAGRSREGVNYASSGTGSTGQLPGGRKSAGAASSTRKSRVRPVRTIYVLHESSAATKGLQVSLIWMVIVIFMATADALSPKTFIQVSAWVSLFFLGVMLSFWALLSPPRAAAATGALIGTFLGPYSLTWQLWVTYVKHWGNFLPVRLYPFTIVLNATEWYAMMVFGFILLAGSIAALVYLGRSKPTFVRVHHDSAQAYRLDE